MPLSSQQQAEIQKQYDPMRKRAQQQEAANLQGQNDAIARRAAASGGGPGGAYDKQTMLAQDSSAKRLQDANEGIDAQQSGALNQAREVQAQRDFQSGERVASQQFAASERQGSQAFAADQAAKQLTAQKEMQAKQIEAAALEGKLSREQANKQLTELQRQYDLDLAENKKTNVIGAITSAYNSGIPPQQWGQLFAAMGIDVGAIPGLTAETVMTEQEKDVQARQQAYTQTPPAARQKHGGRGGSM